MRWLDGITDSMDMSLSKFWETVEEGGATGSESDTTFRLNNSNPRRGSMTPWALWLLELCRTRAGLTAEPGNALHCACLSLPTTEGWESGGQPSSPGCRFQVCEPALSHSLGVGVEALHSRVSLSLTLKSCWRHTSGWSAICSGRATRGSIKRNAQEKATLKPETTVRYVFVSEVASS